MIIKRFDSPNDLYRDLLQIKALQVQHLPTDANFEFDIKHCRVNFRRKDLQYWFARILCGVFYVTGIGLFAAVIILQDLRLPLLQVSNLPCGSLRARERVRRKAASFKPASGRLLPRSHRAVSEAPMSEGSCRQVLFAGASDTAT